MKPRRLVVAPRARREIVAIAEWYRTSIGSAAAAKVMRTLRAGLKAVTTISLAAATRADLPPGYLRVVAKRHVIVFRIVHNAARVVRVLHGARDIPSALEDGD